MIQFSIGSFSFHRLLGEGKQDIFQYIGDCKELGCTHLQPWNTHFIRQTDIDEVLKSGRNPGLADLPEWAMPPFHSMGRAMTPPWTSRFLANCFWRAGATVFGAWKACQRTVTR